MLFRSAVLAFHDAYEPEENMITLTNTFIDTDLTGLPPLLFQASQAEILQDDAIMGYEKAKKYDVETEIQLWER